MRVRRVGRAMDPVEYALEEAAPSAAVTRDHPDVDRLASTAARRGRGARLLQDDVGASRDAPQARQAVG